MMKRKLFLLFLVVSSFCHGQILNAYAKVTAISSASILSVSNVNITSHSFTVGGEVIVMQMQDNCIGTNTANAVSFGDISTIANAGYYQIKRIGSVSPAVGTPTSITLTSTLSGAYNFGTNSSVQIITFRNLGTNYSTTANIVGLPWDGNIGGVVAVQVTNTLTLNHSISADGIGFRGGSRSNNADETCNNGFYIGNDANKGFKGEGIYKKTDNTFNNGRAKILSGGGGGSQNNAGGGGGGNYSSGGVGGLGWTCSAANSGQGYGGITLGSYISSTRVFMGGGGGGGQQNNGVSSDGGNGGGIVFIKATNISTGAVCGTPVSISANGINSPTAGNDGAGGGGAGGSLIINVGTYSISGTCSLTVSSSGGNGGQVNDGGAHGGGGGGGQGAIIYSSVQPTLNVVSTTLNGLAGPDNSNGTSVTAASGGGTNNTGISSAMATPLPIELVEFKAECGINNGDLLFSWSTLTETNNDYFIIEKSTDGVQWLELVKVNGSGNSRMYKTYNYSYNTSNGNMIYFRLKQVDYDGTISVYPFMLYNNQDCFSSNNDYRFFPNPANDKVTIQDFEKYSLFVIYNPLGQLVLQGNLSSSDIFVNNMANGIYSLQLVDKKGNVFTKKMIVDHN